MVNEPRRISKRFFRVGKERQVILALKRQPIVKVVETILWKNERMRRARDQPRIAGLQIFRDKSQLLVGYFPRPLIYPARRTKASHPFRGRSGIQREIWACDDSPEDCI